MDPYGPGYLEFRDSGWSSNPAIGRLRDWHPAEYQICRVAHTVAEGVVDLDPYGHLEWFVRRELCCRLPGLQRQSGLHQQKFPFVGFERELAWACRSLTVDGIDGDHSSVSLESENTGRNLYDPC